MIDRSDECERQAPPDEDHMALSAATTAGAGLCTIVGIHGSFSRRTGAQLAILPGGEIVGSLADGCLEQQLARDCRALSKPEVRRYGAGSPLIDFRLPCGGGLDILLDPAPDPRLCASVLRDLQERRPAALPLGGGSSSPARQYIPRLRIVAFGEGPELAAFDGLARAAGFAIESVEKNYLSLGRHSGRKPADAWTAKVLLFHDHEWELALLEEALASDAFYIGAQGGMLARSARLEALRQRGIGSEALARIRGPIGVSPGSRTPHTLALSVLTEIAHEYERLRPQF